MIIVHTLCMYNLINMIHLRGRVQFPTGGNDESLAREPKGRFWCDSRADSIVWMGEGEGAAFMQ